MIPVVGYYVHHQGQGHRDRARLIARAMTSRVVLLGTGLATYNAAERVIGLADDRCSPDFAGIDGSADRPRALHYAPLGHIGIADRVATMTGWFHDARPALLVVDVSVEVAMLARLASIPVAYMRLSGDRTDPAHLDAFRGARALIAPFHKQLEDQATPDWVREKSVYAPGLCPRPAPAPRVLRRILVIIGRGAQPFDGAILASAAAATPDWRWRVVGTVAPPAAKPANLDLVGWTEDMAREIPQADIVVGAAGDGVVHLALAGGAPFICIPEPRAYDEQTRKAQALAREGAALVMEGWPQPTAWPAILQKAQQMPDAARHALDDPNGVARLAGYLDILARSTCALAKDDQ